MSTFRGRVLFAGIIAILMGSVLLFYSIYQVSILDNLTEKDKSFYVPISREVAALGGLFQSYRLNINKIVSEPTKYSTYEIQNSPLKSQIDMELEKISQTIVNFYSKDQEQETKKYLDNVDTISKLFRDYNVAAMAVVQALAQENQRKGQESVDVDKFVSIVKDSDSAILSSINGLTDTLDERVTLGSINTHRYFDIVMKLLFILWVLDIVFIIGMVVYSKKVSNYIFMITDCVSKIKDDQFSPEDISNNIPIHDEAELFELADKVTHLAKTIHDNASGYKDRIHYLEGDNNKHKIIAAYMSSIFNSVDMAVMTTDSLLKVSFVNGEFERLWKMKRASLVDTDIAALPFIKTISGWGNALSKTVMGNNKKDIITFKGEFKTSTKSKRNLEFHVMPLKDQNTRDILGSLTVIREL